jgi:hypothetical protein
MNNPFDGFQRGLMTGGQMGQGMYRARGDRTYAGQIAARDYTGAAATAGQYGDTQGAERAQGLGTRQAVGTALASGDFNAATTAAGGDMDMLNTIRQFRDSASQAEITAAGRRAENFARLGLQLLEIKDPVQRRQQALVAAGQAGIPPEQIPENLTDEMLTGWYRSNMSAAELLAERRDERNATRPIITQFGVILPPGATPPNSGNNQPQSLGANIPPGWSAAPPNPNQPAPGQPVRATSERAQTPRVSFQSSGDAQQAVAALVPGVRVTNADRTSADTARLRRQGYNPSSTSFHLQGQALDLAPPAGMTMEQLEARMRQAGFRVLNERTHIHVSW